MEVVQPRPYNKTGLGNGNGNGRTSSSSYSHEPSLKRRRPVKLPTSAHVPQKSWWNDPETKRRCRVAKYKLYTAEGRFKGSLKAGFRWLKYRCIKITTSNNK